MKVPTIRRKFSICKKIGAIILSLTTTFQPIKHQPLETMRTCLMEVDCSMVKDQCRNFSRIMLHRVSKDNNIKVAIEQII